MVFLKTRDRSTANWLAEFDFNSQSFHKELGSLAVFLFFLMSASVYLQFWLWLEYLHFLIR